jgi:hypothetical protein
MSNISKDQLAEWKARYGNIYKITVEDKVCYLRKPSRKALGYASAVGKTNPIKFNEILLNDCWLGGDEVIKTDDNLFLSASAKLAELIDVKEAELEKL